MALSSRALAFSALIYLAATSAHAERHYDCTKPGNASKAACKAATAAAPAAAPGATTQTAATVSTRHYDCSKPGNANKAACKGAAAAPSTTTTTTTATAATAAPTPTKPSIFSRMMKPKTQPAAASANAAPASAPTTTASAAPVGAYKGKSITADAAGATGQCKDGTYTHATHHSGACSSHGGVAKWMQ